MIGPAPPLPAGSGPALPWPAQTPPPAFSPATPDGSPSPAVCGTTPPRRRSSQTLHRCSRKSHGLPPGAGPSGQGPGHGSPCPPPTRGAHLPDDRAPRQSRISDCWCSGGQSGCQMDSVSFTHPSMCSGLCGAGPPPVDRRSHNIALIISPVPAPVNYQPTKSLSFFRKSKKSLDIWTGRRYNPINQPFK